MVFSLLLAAALVPLAAAAGGGAEQPAYDLLERLLGRAAGGHFRLSLINATCAPGVDRPCFALSDEEDGTVAVRATGMSELTYGIGYYLRFRCNMTVGWPRGGGSSTTLPAVWPQVGAAVAIRRAVPWTYIDNVCTHSYSYPWYDESAWTQHIDWMAISGINVFLAITGQEEVQYKVFREFGLSDMEIRSFFNGPAYLTWSRGQSMQGIGSPLPRSWMQSQWKLQKRILARARPLGMIGVLPAFQGNMPPQIRALHPRANISKGDCAWVASTDPLFGRVADSWMKTLIEDFGTQHWYQCDGFFTGLKPPWYASEGEGRAKRGGATTSGPSESATGGDFRCDWSASAPDAFVPGCSLDCKSFPTLDAAKAACEVEETCGGVTQEPGGGFQLRSESGTSPSPSGEVSWLIRDPLACHPVVADQAWAPVWENAWKGMARTDPKAMWLYQGWAIRGWSDRAGAARLKALYDAVPHGQWIPLDMDVNGIWRYFGNYSFFGAPFIWTTLHNMGGNDGMKGDMRLLSKIPSDAIVANASIAGTGATPEGIDQNPAYYEYAFDTAWHASPTPLKQWFADYPAYRYGAAHTSGTAEAWAILVSTVYASEAGGWHDNTGVEWNPVGKMIDAVTMDTASVYRAWKLLVDAAASDVNLRRHAPLRYDIVNVGREVLAQLITAMVRNLTSAVAAQDRSRSLKLGSVLLDAYDDVDELVGCDDAFLIGPWIAAARSWANSSDAPAEYYEWQARSQVSTWWPVTQTARRDPATYLKPPALDGYANKHWNGLIRDFYAARVRAYLDQVREDLPTRPLNRTKLTAAVVAAELNFTLDHSKTYAMEPIGGAVAVSRRLIAKYAQYLEEGAPLIYVV